LVTDKGRLPDPLPAAARMPAGSLVILRHYDDPERERLARRLAMLCRCRRLRLLIAGDWRLARMVGAGLHLAEGLVPKMPVAARLHRRRSGQLLTVAAHGRAGLARAAQAGADAALLSPVFPTLSHPGQAALGRCAFRRLVAQARLPVYALGGVTVATVLGLARSKAQGVAAIGGFAPQQSGAHEKKETAQAPSLLPPLCPTIRR
jgi:thiamine-phosphate pyrophosphorylase